MGFWLNGFLKTWRRWGTHSRCVAVIDAILLASAVYFSYALRFTIFLNGASHFGIVPVGCLWLLSVMASFAFFGVYDVYWPQASVEELLLLLKAYAVPCMALGALYFFLPVPFVVPLSVMGLLILDGIALIAAARLSWRPTGTAPSREKRKKTLIVGAGDAGSQAARDLLRHGAGDDIVGFLDDDPMKKDKKIAGIPVLGALKDLHAVIEKYGARSVLVSLPSVPRARLKVFLSDAVPLDVDVRILPPLRDLADGHVTLREFRPVKLEDLLGREPVCLDTVRIGELLKDKTVLVTGAGGSIGSEIVRQILPYAPRKLLALGHGEFSIYTLMEELQNKKYDAQIVPIIADVADERAMKDIFSREKIDVIFHAAAHKHVPLMENNAREAVRVNCLGTWTLAQLAGESGTKRMVMISTDKAVHPSSVMGATKRIAEMTLVDLQRHYPGTAYMSVRFGNVLGSRGSVIPKFERQIAAGGPVTVTHPEMMRYFMLIPEAAGLVLQAATLGERGCIYVLDMGEPMKITDLAETLIRLKGYEPNKDIKIVYTGIRPGEKLFEELFYDRAHVDKTSHPKIFCTQIDENHLDETADMYDKINEILRSDEPKKAIAKVLRDYRCDRGENS
ncbi:MAG: polysaccharide biosynthesis protein [Pyramidobacter sp.]|jgi:FlaA1/EpsC-like NDP-sugar epimerase